MTGPSSAGPSHLYEIGYEGVLGTWWVKCPTCGFDRRGFLSDVEADQAGLAHQADAKRST